MVSQEAQWWRICLPMQETWVCSLGREIPWRREWQATAVFLPGESHGRRTLVAYSPWGHKEPLHFLSLCNSMDHSTPGSSVLHYLPEFSRFMSIELMILSNHLILCHPLLLLPSVFPNISIFSSESALCIRWSDYWSFSFSISPNEYSELIPFRIDWFDLLVVQATLKILLKQHSLKASFLRHSAFFMVQLLHLYITTGKAVALTIWTSVGKVLSAF